MQNFQKFHCVYLAESHCGKYIKVGYTSFPLGRLYLMNNELKNQNSKISFKLKTVKCFESREAAFQHEEHLHAVCATLSQEYAQEETSQIKDGCYTEIYSSKIYSRLSVRMVDYMSCAPTILLGNKLYDIGRKMVRRMTTFQVEMYKKWQKLSPYTAYIHCNDSLFLCLSNDDLMKLINETNKQRTFEFTPALTDVVAMEMYHQYVERLRDNLNKKFFLEKTAYGVLEKTTYTTSRAANLINSLY